MRVLIFEDEKINADHLQDLVKRYDGDIEIAGVLESIKAGLIWFESNKLPDLIFMDIHLADGLCFEIFETRNIEVPVIFTTAYDEYSLQAFKVNSIDYLLKPINFSDLKSALDKFIKHQMRQFSELQSLLMKQIQGNYKKRFLVKIGEQYKNIAIDEISFLISEEGLVFAVLNNGSRYPLDFSLDQLERMTDPARFFRVNRKIIVSHISVKKIHTYFNSRLKLELQPSAEVEVIVSRERVADFKNWLEG
ncbi:MAG: hypothetical protein A2W91_07770 [Bacteroidetes bacterium GWF2_38_335]|nr:MAG: hypothetical protein A2W91_07770 [Bacteroidetes bacterium GWF2_38_335]OFY79049.1 MAG: hypothetical protein A2281_02950 [Bacteroidetes bacterium RIFOXYA12_FULL_38_20]HBS86130.1 DNA-binding response regulator [Bacteroidales bacterium]